MVFKKLFGKRRSRSEDHENGHYVDIDEKNSLSQPAAQAINQERRNILQGILSIGGLAALSGLTEACTKEENMALKFKNNFDSSDYPQFDDADLAEAQSRDQEKITPEDCLFDIQTAMDKELSTRIDANDLFRFQASGDETTIVSILDTATGKEDLLRNNPAIKEVITVEHSGYDWCFQMVTEQGKITIKASQTNLIIGDEHKNTELVMLYNPNSRYVQSSKEYSDYQRRVTTGPIGIGAYTPPKAYIFEGGRGLLEYEDEQVQAFSKPNMPRTHIYETETFLEFLKNTQSNAMIKSFLMNVRGQNINLAGQRNAQELAPAESFFSFTDIKSIDQLIEVFRLLPPKPEIYGALLRLCVKYQAWDKSKSDEYRAPLTTLRSGWGDCDDFAVINYFWAYLHNFSPNFTVAHSSKSNQAHVLVWYRDDQNRLVVMDNHDIQLLAPSYTIEGYLTEYSSAYISTYTGEDWIIDYNGPA